MFRIEFSKNSEKFLKKTEEGIYNRILNKLDKLSENPFPSDSKRIVNKEGKLFRIRIGDYRIIYEVFYKENTRLIHYIDKRSRVYDN